MPDKGPDHVRGDDADKADGACERDRAARREPGAEHGEDALGAQVEADAAGSFLAEREGREAAPRGKQDGCAKQNEGGCKADLAEAAIGDRAQHPVDHVGKREGIWCEVHQEAHGRAGKAGEADTDQDKRDNRAGTDGGERDESRGGQRAEDGREGQDPRRECDQPVIEREGGCKRGRSRDTEHAGLSERVAEQALQRCAADAERGADHVGGEGTGQADLPDHEPVACVAAAKESREHTFRRHRRRAEQAGGEEGEYGRRDQRGEEPDIGFHFSLPSANASMASIRNQPLQDVHAPSSETTGWSASCARATGWFVGLQAPG